MINSVHFPREFAGRSSLVIIQFELSKNIDTAFNEVQAKLNEILQRLPDDAETPVLKKVEAGSPPIMWLALQGNNTLQQLNVCARNVIKKRLETISGVGDVVIAGERRRTIRVNLDLDKLSLVIGKATQRRSEAA